MYFAQSWIRLNSPRHGCVFVQERRWMILSSQEHTEVQISKLKLKLYRINQKCFLVIILNPKIIRIYALNITLISKNHRHEGYAKNAHNIRNFDFSKLIFVLSQVSIVKWIQSVRTCLPKLVQWMSHESWMFPIDYQFTCLKVKLDSRYDYYWCSDGMVKGQGQIASHLWPLIDGWPNTATLVDLR